MNRADTRPACLYVYYPWGLGQADRDLRDAQGRAIPWPDALAGDKGYRADWVDEYLLDLEIRPVIPSKENEDRDARPAEFERDQYKLTEDRLASR